MTAGRAGRLRAAACLLAATVLILLAAKTCAKPVQRVAVVVAPGGDPLRAAAFANGAEFMLSQANGLEMRLFETDGSLPSLRKVGARLAQEQYCGVLTNVGQAALLADGREIPVLTTGTPAQAIRTTAGRDDEVAALLSYAGETGMESLAILLPDGTAAWGELLGWLCTHLESNLYAYTDQDGGITAALDSIVAQQADGVLVWGDTTEVPRMISGLRHAGYTGAILGPSFLAGYESLGINAGQATGLRFAAQYTDPRHNAEVLTRRQQQFIREYTAYFGEEPLFAESYYGADQALILEQMLRVQREGDPPLGPLLRCGRIEGIVQPYDYSRNPSTGITGMVVYQIQSGHIEEAR